MLPWLIVSLVIVDLVTAKDMCSTITSLSPNCVCSTNQIDVNIRCSYNGTVDKINQGDATFHIDHLDLSGSNISSLPLDFFNGVDVIHHIDLSDNQFTRIPSAINNIKQLTTLDMSENKLSQFDFSTVGNVENLRHLDVSSNSITSLDTSSAPIKSLHTVNMANNNIDTVEAKSLVAIPNLKHLNLADNDKLESLNDVEYPVHFAEFNISNTIVNQLSACALTRLDDFQMFDLTNTKIPCSCELASLLDKVTLNSEDLSFRSLFMDAPQWTCLDDNHDVILVSTLHNNCSAKADICQFDITEYQVELHSHDLKNFKVDIMNKKSEEIELEWGGINSSHVFGYRVVVRSDEGDVYTSTILHPSVQSHTVIGSEVKQGSFDVCVQVYHHNVSSIAHESCKTVSVQSLTVYIGVMAGVVFLIPFTVMLLCIIKNDRFQRRREKLYLAIDAEESKLYDQKQSQTNGHNSSNINPPQSTMNQTIEASKLGQKVFLDGEKSTPIITAREVIAQTLTSEKDNQSFVCDDIESQTIDIVRENETYQSVKRQETQSQHQPDYPSRETGIVVKDTKTPAKIQPTDASTHL